MRPAPKTPPDRLPPHSIEAERAVLGCVLASPAAGVGAFRDVFDASEPALYDPRHVVLFGTIETMLAEGRQVDMVTICARLEAKGALENVGGWAYLCDLTADAPPASAIGHYLEIVKDRLRKRQIIAACTHAIRDAYGEEDYHRILDRASSQVHGVSQLDTALATGPLNGVALAAAATEHAQAIWEDANSNARPANRVPTGLRLDDKIAIEPGMFIVIAARPSVGKTSLATTITANACAAGYHVHFSSLEVRAKALGLKLACTVGRVNMSLLRRQHGMDQEDFARLAHAYERIAGWPITVEADASMTVSQFRHRLRRAKEQHGVKLAVVDYLQRMKPDRDYGSEEANVAAISDGLKSAALETGVPVLALSQLNRESAKTKGRPRMDQTRGSGSIEQDADVVALLWRHRDGEEVSESAEPPAEEAVDCILDKNRDGEVGTVPLIFVRRFTLFEDAPIPMPQQSQPDLYQAPYAE